MKLSFRYAYGVSSLPMFIKPPLFRNTCSVQSHLPQSISPMKLQVPIFLRPPIHTTTVSDFRKWNEWAKSLASSVGMSFVDLDNGPDSTLLTRELKWLIDDSIEDPKAISDHNKDVRMRVRLDELYELWKQRIEERRPFQYVVGCEHWRDFVLCVQEGVLIPRPETETIVELVIDAVSDNEGLRNGLWVDLGTGSGALAIGIGAVLKGKGKVIATDLSPLALSVAQFNLQRYDLQDVIELRQGSWFEPLKDVEGKLSGIISNPPYIPSDNIPGLQAEVGRHEPKIALDGGENGMDDLLLLSKGVAFMLKPGGFFAFETNGEKQCKHLVEHMETEARDTFRDVKVVCDFSGVQRFVTGFRK